LFLCITICRYIIPQSASIDKITEKEYCCKLEKGYGGENV
jgi:hypothetical protein